MKRLVLLLYVFCLVGCGGGGGGGEPEQQTTVSFTAVDFSTLRYYTTTATKVAERAHCYIYLEQGQSVSQTAINAIADQFDNAIYPGETTAFGSEPNPGIDNDPKVYILLLDIKGGFTPTSMTFIAGYFDPTNEFSQSQNPNSNQKEILFMNVNPATGVVPDEVGFFATISHEFHHLVHWEQKAHQRGVNDDTWIEEAMAQLSRTYCGYGPDYATIFDYEESLRAGANHSLVAFDGTVGNYGMVYMWAQYVKDQLDATAAAATGHTIFWQMLHNSSTGITEVNDALTSIGASRDFTAVFRDWAVANFFGNGSTVTSPQPQWSYTSINTWPGTYSFNLGQDRITLPGLFPASRQNLPTLQALDQWSLAYYSFTPMNPPTGTVTWTKNATTTAASFIDGNSTTPSVTFDMVSGTAYPFTNVGYLIHQNPSGTSQTAADSATRTAISSLPAVQSTGAVRTTMKTPSQLMAAMQASPVVRRFVEETGKPHRVDVDYWFREQEKALRAQGMRPPF